MDLTILNISNDIFIQFRQFITYGFEDTYTTSTNEFDLRLRNDFFSRLYFERPYFEDKIKTWLTSHGGDLGIVVGVQGSGKSTILKKVSRSLDLTAYPFLSINFRIFFEQQLEKNDVKMWKTLVDNYLKEDLTTRYFNEDRIDKFFSYFLYEDKDTHNIFHKERNKIHRTYKSLVHSGVNASEEEWFTNSMYRPELLPVLDEIERKLALEHYLIAARLQSDNKVSTFIIVFDNVDRVPKDFQCRIYQIAEDLRSIHMTSANIIISTRKETCHPPEQVCNLNPAPIAEFGIYSSYESDKNKLTSDDFFHILTRRLNLFIHNNQDNPDAKTLVDISMALKNEYAEAFLINLANQSIRDALRYHCDFVHYLLSHYNASELSRIIEGDRGGSFLLSCLYGWTTTHSRVLHRQCVNVVELLAECKRSSFKDIAGCDLTYLILVCLYNCRIRHDRNLTVEELIHCFIPLSYSEKAIRDALFDLWRLRKEDFGLIVSIYQYPIPEKPNEIKMSTEIEINYRGEALIKRISVSFTFINRLLFDSDDDDFYSTSEKRKIERYYDLQNLPTHARFSVRFLFKLAYLHSLELHKIRTRYNNDNWLNEYTKEFCIDKKLQLTRIIRSNNVFLGRVIEQNNNALSQTTIEGLKNIIRRLEFLEKLYNLQTKSFTPQNISNTQIVDFSKVYGYVCQDSSRLTNENSYLSSQDFKTDIKHLL